MMEKKDREKIKKLPKVVVVDDEETILKFYKSTLRDICEVYPFKIATEAFSFIVSNPDVSLTIIDRRLPSVSGDELCMKLREHPYTKDISIIIVSGLKDIDEIAEVMDKIGIKTYLTKPISPDVLRNHVGVYLKNA